MRIDPITITTSRHYVEAAVDALEAALERAADDLQEALNRNMKRDTPATRFNLEDAQNGYDRIDNALMTFRDHLAKPRSVA